MEQGTIQQPLPGEVYLGGADGKEYRRVIEIDRWGYVVAEATTTRRRMTRRGLGEKPETRTFMKCCTPLQWGKWARNAKKLEAK